MKGCPTEDVFADWLDAKLAPEAIEKLDAHLDTCEPCRALYVELSRGDDSTKTEDHRTPNRQATPKSPAIGRFLVERVLGEGGMGTVFLARDPDLDRRIAIKVLRPGGDAERLTEEARSQAQLSHPNVVRVYEVGHGATGLYIAMELVDGENLRDVIKRRPPWSEIVAAFVAAGHGLAAAHHAGLVHRDFKPANVLVGADGRIAVTDFGLARSGRRSRAPTEAGMVAGTPAYLAPELWRGQNATELSDQYAFGISLYEGLFGVRPTDGAVALQADVDVPEWLRDVALRALSDEPSERFPSMDALLAAIDEHVAPGATRRDCPFPGLAAFDTNDSDVYFGRDTEVAEAARRIADTGFLAVVGPSGSGKSSFVRAGLVPALRRHSRTVELLIRPGRNPRATLGKLVGELAREIGDPNAEISKRPELLGQVLAAHGRARQSRVVLVVDQLEELFTLTHDSAEQVVFLAALDALTEQFAERVCCVITLRSDLIERAQVDRRFLRRISSSLLFLANPDRETLRAALIRPLAQVSYRLESPEIADAIADELEGKSGALPLLQFTARQLWAKADHDRKLITTASYRALGELAGLLADHATSVMTALGPVDRKLARSILVRLVTPERTRAVVPVAELHKLGGDVAHVMETLVSARLVVIEDGDVPAAELVHEALIDRWPTLLGWLDELDQGDALFAEVSEAARRWSARGRAPGLLWQGETARRLDNFQAHHRGTLSDDEAAFVAAALALDRAQRRRRRTGIVAAFVALVAIIIGAAVAIVMIRDAAEVAKVAAIEAKASEARVTAQQAETSREADRARAAERQLAEQLEALRREQRVRVAAEARVTSTNKELTLTYDQLRVALAKAEREAERATKASATATAAAERERALRAQTEALLAAKKVELARALERAAQINQTLKGAP